MHLLTHIYYIKFMGTLIIYSFMFYLYVVIHRAVCLKDSKQAAG